MALSPYLLSVSSFHPLALDLDVLDSKDVERDIFKVQVVGASADSARLSTEIVSAKFIH